MEHSDANCEDPDKTLHYAVSDIYLYCLRIFHKLRLYGLTEEHNTVLLYDAACRIEIKPSIKSINRNSLREPV